MIRWFRWPLAASIVGHCGVAALLVLFAANLPPAPLPIAQGIEVMLSPPEPVAEPPPPEPPPPPVQAEPPPPEPPPPVVQAAPPPPEPPPPPPRPKSKPVVRRPPPVRQPVRRPPPEPVPYRPVTPYVQPPTAPVQTAVIPRPPAPPPRPTVPIVSANYRASLSAWLESHKRYPESARERGEEGRAILRFRVARSGQVLNYAVVQSTGYPDLDAAVDQMMRGASLPPFPADMTATDVEVSVPVRFALAR